MKIHEYNEMMSYLTRPGMKTGGRIGGGMIQGQDMGYRTGFYEPKLITDKRSPHKGEYSFRAPSHTKTVQNNPIFKKTLYGDKTKIQELIDKYTKLAKKSYLSKDDAAKTRVRNEKFKNLVDDIIKKGNLSVFKSDRRAAGGIIPDQWMTDIFNPAIKAGKNSPEMKQLAEILERSEDEILELDNVRKGQIRDYKIKYIDTRKALAAVDKNKLKFLDIVNSSDKINLKAVAKQLGLSQTATNDLINSVYKDIYKNTSLLGKGETNFVRYLPKAQTPLRDLLRSMNKIEGVDKIERRTITDLLDKAIGFKAAKKYRNPELYTIFKDRINEYYKLKDALPDNIKLNLDHPLPMNVIRQMGSEARLQTLNVSPITQELNLGLKAQFDKAYGRAIKEGDTSVQKAIEKIVKQIDLPLTKVGSQVTDPSKFQFVSQDLKTQIISSLEKQKSIAEKLKKVDPKLLEKAGMAKYKIFNSMNTLLANANTETIMKVRKALDCPSPLASGGRVGLQGGGNLLECPMKKFAENPEAVLNKVGQAVPETRTPIINAVKNTLGAPLRWGGKAFSFAGKTLSPIATPFGAGALWGVTGFDKESAVDRATLGAEAAFAPELVKMSSKMTKPIQNQTMRSIVRGVLNAGMPLKWAMRAARVASPIGWATLGAEGIYQLGKYAMEEQKRIKEMAPEQKKEFEAEQEEIGAFSAAEGGRVGFGSGSTFDAHTKREAAFKAYKDYKKSYYSSRQRYPILTFRQFLPLYAAENYNQGGRVGFDKGSPKSPGRRAFIKGITALAALPVVGKFFKLGKVLEAGQYTGPAIQKIKGMPEWFPSLVKKLWNEGEDVTKQVSWKERQVVKRGTLEGGDDVDLVYDLDTEDVHISVTPKKGTHETTSGAYNKEYELDYKKGQVDETTKGKKPPDDFSVSEIEGAADPYAMDVNWEGKVTTVDDAMTDLTELEAFARDKTTKQIHKKKGTKPKDVFPDYDPGDFGRDLD